MGVSINLHVYNKDRLVSDIDRYVVKNGGYREGAHRPDSFLELVGPEFGVVTADKFMVVWNEYYEEYNPASNFLEAVDHYYFPNHEQLGEESENGYWDTFWSDAYSTESEGNQALDVLETVFPAEFDWEKGTLRDRSDDE